MTGGARPTGGGTSAVAASTHAGCERFRHTDSLVIGMSRRRLASLLGAPDTTAGIPVARRIRAGLFERLVRANEFASRLTTTAIGSLGLARPSAVHRVDCLEDIGRTRDALRVAHDRALAGEATLLNRLALPFPGMEHDEHATPVLPDFAFVAARRDDETDTGEPPVGSWLIMGDAKDYERVRSRISDSRMLKGFLQVAMGAEAADCWSARPTGMFVHRHGALAVPRNSFLQPTVVTEDLGDHRDEVRGRVDERARLVQELGEVPLSEDDALAWVDHLEARFDPATCAACPLFTYCRRQLRTSGRHEDLLVEIGVPPEHRRHALGIIVDGQASGVVPVSVRDQVAATITGLPVWVGAGRTDPIGRPGTVDVLLAKSDSAATGVHGVAVRTHSRHGTSAWAVQVFVDPQSRETRRAVLRAVGSALRDALDDVARGGAADGWSIHLVAPDEATTDLLVSIADTEAGVELARIGWEHDLAQGRQPLTFNGERAAIPPPLTPEQRLAASFLLEDDRARTMSLRSATVSLTKVLSRLMVAGGSVFEAGRLDYLVTWASADGPVDYHAVSDAIASSRHTPGARLSNVVSNELHESSPRGESPDSAAYHEVVREELEYKAHLLEAALDVLDRKVAPSRLAAVYAAIEADAQTVWWRRYQLEASDLVRFSRTARFWRNGHIDILDNHDTTGRLLAALHDPRRSQEHASDIGTRDVHHAVVASTAPFRLSTSMRRFADAQNRIVVLCLNGRPMVEEPHVVVKFERGAFKLHHMTLGPLEADAQTAVDGTLRWSPGELPPTAFQVGDELVIMDYGSFVSLTSTHILKVPRPGVDEAFAPKATCGPGDFTHDPASHRWCCVPHAAQEAERADRDAAARAAGRMNPQTWPPLADSDAFDIAVPGAPTADDLTIDQGELTADDLTIDDLD